MVVTKHSFLLLILQLTMHIQEEVPYSPGQLLLTDHIFFK